jgi:hypothetical protein
MGAGRLSWTDLARQHTRIIVAVGTVTDLQQIQNHFPISGTNVLYPIGIREKPRGITSFLRLQAPRRENLQMCK